MAAERVRFGYSDNFLMNSRLPLITVQIAMCCLFSQSGETYDTKQAIEWAKQAKMSTSAVVNSPHSTIARAVDDYIFQNTGPEISVVSTKAGVAQLIIMHRISMALGVCNGTKTVKDQQDYDHKLRQFAAQLDSILSSLFTAVKVIAKELINFKHMLWLRQGDLLSAST